MADILRRFFADPDQVDSLSEPEVNALLTRLGLDVEAMETSFAHRTRDAYLEAILVELDAQPRLIDLLPPDLVVTLMRYIGVIPDRAMFTATLDAIQPRH